MKIINAKKVRSNPLLRDLFDQSVVWLIKRTIIGKVVNHQFAKELLAGFVGGEVDKLAETKGKSITPVKCVRSLGPITYAALRSRCCMLPSLYQA